MIAAVIACLVFTGFTKENVSDTVDHNAWKTSGVVVIQNDILTLAGSNARALLNDGKGYTNFELDMDVRTTTGGKGYIGIQIIIQLRIVRDREADATIDSQAIINTRLA